MLFFSLPQEATELLEERLHHLQESGAFARQVAKHALLSGGGAVSDSIQILSLVSGGSGGLAGGLGKVGAEAAAKIFGEDVGKEISKLLLHSSGRLLSGSVTVVLGGATMAYDIYRLGGELEHLSTGGKREAAAEKLRDIARQLEVALGGLGEEEAEVEEKKS